jgi:recombinase-like zinc beta ribbon protein/recombinase
VLRNRVYIGEIYYRGNWYPAPHEPLIPKELFDKAQAILTERREDRSKRAANPAEYLLTGRVRCGRCGQAYVGTAAHGRNDRYTYYTCFTRARYGTKHCANDRLPAERLEQAVTRRLWQVLDDNDLIDRAITDTYERLSQRDGEQQSEWPGYRTRSQRHAQRWTATSARSRPGRCPRTPAPRALRPSASRRKHLSAAPASLSRSRTTTSGPSASAPPTSTRYAATCTPCSTTATPSASRVYSKP